MWDPVTGGNRAWTQGLCAKQVLYYWATAPHINVDASVLLLDATGACLFFFKVTFCFSDFVRHNFSDLVRHNFTSVIKGAVCLNLDLPQPCIKVGGMSPIFWNKSSAYLKGSWTLQEPVAYFLQPPPPIIFFLSRIPMPEATLSGRKGRRRKKFWRGQRGSALLSHAPFCSKWKFELGEQHSPYFTT